MSLLRRTSSVDMSLKCFLKDLQFKELIFRLFLLLHSVDDMSLVYWWEILQAILRPTFSPNAISDVTTILSEFSLQIYLLPPFRFKSSNISLPFKMSKLKVWRKAIYNFSMTIFRFLWVRFVTLVDIILISFRM